MVCTDIFSKQSEQDSSLSAATKTFQQVGSFKLKRLNHEIYLSFFFKHVRGFHRIDLFSQKILGIYFPFRH